jgi:hypothetical protein
MCRSTNCLLNSIFCFTTLAICLAGAAQGANPAGKSNVPAANSRLVRLKFPEKSLGSVLLGPNLDSSRVVSPAKGLVSVTVPANCIISFSASGLLGRNPEAILQTPEVGIEGLEVSLLDMDSEKRSATDCLLKYITHFKNLRALRIGQSDVTEKGIWYVSKGPSLTFLDIRETNLSENAINSLAALTRLEFLRLEIINATDQAMKGLSKLQNLNWIDLTGSVGFGSSVAELLSKLPKLAALCLSRTKTGDEGLLHFSRLTKLKQLSVDCTLITDKGIESLTLCKSLEYLELSGNPKITDRCIPSLLKIRTLNSLAIGKTRISWDGIKRLKALHLEALVVDNKQVTATHEKELTSIARDVTVINVVNVKQRRLNDDKTELCAPLH